MIYVECELSKGLIRIRLFDKSCPYLKKLQFFSIISFKTVFLVLRNIEFFRFFWFRANVMGYLECELSKGLVRIRLFEKSCPYLKKLQFSLWSVSKQFFWYCEILNFSGFSGLEPMLWVMWNVNFQKVWSEYVYLKKKLSLFEEVAVFAMISFKCFSVLWNTAIFL